MMPPKFPADARKEACAHARAHARACAHTLTCSCIPQVHRALQWALAVPSPPSDSRALQQGEPNVVQNPAAGQQCSSVGGPDTKALLQGGGMVLIHCECATVPRTGSGFSGAEPPVPALSSCTPRSSQPAMHWFGCPITCALACPCCANPSLQPGSAAATCLTCQPHCAQPVHAFQCDQSLHTLLVQPRRDAACLGGGLPQPRAKCTPPFLTFSVAASCPKRRGNTGARGST